MIIIYYFGLIIVKYSHSNELNGYINKSISSKREQSMIGNQYFNESFSLSV